MVVEVPTVEEIKHKEIAEAAGKAWEEVIVMGEIVPDSGMKIEKVLSLCVDVVL